VFEGLLFVDDQAIGLLEGGELAFVVEGFLLFGF
jgi:hypothetical protein